MKQVCSFGPDCGILAVKQWFRGDGWKWVFFYCFGGKVQLYSVCKCVNTLVLNYAGMVVYQLVTIVQLTTTCLEWYFELVAGERG